MLKLQGQISPIAFSQAAEIKVSLTSENIQHSL
jgi:hypothetical protein